MASTQAFAWASLLSTSVPSASRITPRICAIVISPVHASVICRSAPATRQDALTMTRTGGLSRFGGGYDGGFACERQGEPEGGTPTEGTFYTDLPVVLLNNSLADVEAESTSRV